MNPINVIALADVIISITRLLNEMVTLYTTLVTGAVTQDMITPTLTAEQEINIAKARARLRADMLNAGLPEKKE